MVFPIIYILLLKLLAFLKRSKFYDISQKNHTQSFTTYTNMEGMIFQYLT